MTAASASLATAEVLAWLDDPKVWRGEIEVWNETYYRQAHGDPDDVVDIEPAGAFPSGYSVEAACPVCRPGAVADGARPVRCILHGGDDPSIQPTNASASGFRLAGDGETAGWIVRTGDRDVTAGASPMEAAERARRIGFDGGVVRPATADELDSLDLPPSALGIEAGAAPWWRPAPAPVAPEGDPERPVYRDAGADEYGPLLHAWGAVYDADPDTGEPAREYLGVGRLLGYVQRERYYSGDVAYFEVAGEGREAVQSDDVVLPIVERADLSWDAPVRNAFMPEYPRCPDCGGRIEWAEAGGVPSSRRCAGATEPDMPAAGTAASPGGVTSDREAGCGSRYVDTRFGVAGPVPGEGEGADRLDVLRMALDAGSGS